MHAIVSQTRTNFVPRSRFGGSDAHPASWGPHGIIRRPGGVNRLRHPLDRQHRENLHRQIPHRIHTETAAEERRQLKDNVIVRYQPNIGIKKRPPPVRGDGVVPVIPIKHRIEPGGIDKHHHGPKHSCHGSSISSTTVRRSRSPRTISPLWIWYRTGCGPGVNSAPSPGRSPCPTISIRKTRISRQCSTANRRDVPPRY